MSTSQPQPQPEPRVPAKSAANEMTEVRVVQHSQLFYWWPVWAVGFMLAAFSALSNQRTAVVPPDTTIERTADKAYVLKVNGLPPHKKSTGEELALGQTMGITDAKTPFGLHMASQAYLGIIFMITLLLIIIITNVPLRGMWSVVVIICLVLLSVILYLADLWEVIAYWFGLLDIHINAMGYLFVSLSLFVVWAVTMFWFDQQIYIIFTPGLMKVRENIGGAETAYDAGGMTIEHLRDDIFRHWVVGLGSGDLVVHPAGPQSREIRLNNVLFVGRKLQLIEEMKRTSVVTG